MNNEIESLLEKCKPGQGTEIIKRCLRKNMKVLDAGCGVGKYAIHLAEQAKEVVGVDRDKRRSLAALMGLVNVFATLLCKVKPVPGPPS